MFRVALCITLTRIYDSYITLKVLQQMLMQVALFLCTFNLIGQFYLNKLPLWLLVSKSESVL